LETLITTYVNSVLHPSGVAKSSTRFIWGKGGKVTAARLQVTLCDPNWHVISCSSVVKFHELLYTVYFIHHKMAGQRWEDRQTENLTNRIIPQTSISRNVTETVASLSKVLLKSINMFRPKKEYLAA